jgi:hypothetical protein
MTSLSPYTDIRRRLFSLPHVFCCRTDREPLLRVGRQAAGDHHMRFRPAMIVDAHLDIGWNALAHGRGFLQPPATGYLVSRSSLIGAGVGLVFATLYTAPARAGRAMRTRFVYENAHEANIMATARSTTTKAVASS